MENSYFIGVDIGSTTAKVAVLDENGKICASSYRRHYSNTRDTIVTLLREFIAENGDGDAVFAITGSGGMGLAKVMDINFVQEVIAETGALAGLDKKVDVAIELGGEDAKIIYLTGGIDQRMNGICAGGTGSFIDQMAAILQTDAGGLDMLASNAKTVYPIAARCGVFAKTDIQPLINDGAAREDLAYSIFKAVVNQTISGLACGRPIRGNVAFLGGPLHYLKNLRRAFMETLSLTDETAVVPENAHMFAAYGAALYAKRKGGRRLSLTEFADELENAKGVTAEITRLEPLFTGEDDYSAFTGRHEKNKVKKADISTYKGDCYLGIDAGSTTTKIALISDDGELLYSYYKGNSGDPIACAKESFAQLSSLLSADAHIVATCSTGYGEELMKNAFKLDMGEVETIAHYTAAKYFEPNVDCILDIGGQDMKCIRIKDGYVDNIMLNEACSSGCGSFIENFASSMGFTAPEFAKEALFSKNPLDLGTRCTVFMNSNVKQAQKEGASVSDIAAGLAYSVIKNALFKVIKLTDSKALGERIVVQGGTFYNDAVLRALEKTAGVEAIRPDIAGIMGAFGAALFARDKHRADGQTNEFIPSVAAELTYSVSTARCKGCNNSCRLTVNKFSDGRRYISGNRCEKGLGLEKSTNSAPNMFEYKLSKLFDYESLDESVAKRGVIGIPRVLNMYENYPFWATFFKELGFSVVLSPYSSKKIYSLGMESIPSESECYPAKLVHGHIEWLVNNGVKRIFYPCVFYERAEDKNAQNHFNCPMVTSYPENIANNAESLKAGGVKLIKPFLAFTDEKTLTEELESFALNEWGISKKETSRAAHSAWCELIRVREDVMREGERVLEWIGENNARGIVLAGRPYHLDPEINHGIPEMIQGYGVAVLTEDAVSHLGRDMTLRVTNQWMYHSRLYRAAEYVCRNGSLDLIQLNSFGCGLDAVTADQVADILAQASKIYTLLKIDEVNNLGAARIRVRSTLSAIRMRNTITVSKVDDSVFKPVEYTSEMQEKKYTILFPPMSPIHFEILEAAFNASGYGAEMMTREGPEIIEYGLKYTNNDACYPALIVIGQFMEAVLSGRYDTNKLALIMTQTGGGCRASNYIGLIRRALKLAGYGHIPVISLNFTGLEKHSGLKYDMKMITKCVQALYYGDVLSKILLHTRPYEIKRGSADELAEKWKNEFIRSLTGKGFGLSKFKSNINNAVREFDELPVNDGLTKPRVGIVGEILVKYMPLANNHLVELLEAEGAEASLPGMIGFLEYCFRNNEYRHEHLGQSLRSGLIGTVLLKICKFMGAPMKKALEKSRRFEAPESIETIEKCATEVISIGNQCGEGWYLAGEIVSLIKNGVNNVVCTQPFGCLPNHIAGKGIIKKLKELYPGANVIAIDYDPSASRVNQVNRIKMMLDFDASYKEAEKEAVTVK
ncbi:MAG: 2-hydroxyacyl-CoA dehydratase [Clostridia bacterium]|nr:2-hydroxyacyl-CoA dehydratase [Clostridia bacterium]